MRKVSLWTIAYGALSGLTAARSASAQAPREPSTPQAMVASSAATTSTSAPDFDLLTFHRENYFITGFTGATEVKFQFSAKYDLWPNWGQYGVYFAFTEVSLWDVYRKSSPFVELNYAPELFYIYFHHPGRYSPPKGCAFFHERAGAEHESNGERGVRSRSWNRIYVESRFACYGELHEYALATLKVWAPPIAVEDNPHIVQYLGYGQLVFSFGVEESVRWYGNSGVSIAARKGADRILRHGSIEINTRWRPRLIEYSRFTPYLFGQFFTGYGETLLNYDRATTTVRIGFGFSDRSTRVE